MGIDIAKSKGLPMNSNLAFSEWVSRQTDAAVIAASFDVIDLARRTNTPIVQWKDGRIIYSTPDEVEATLPPRPKLKTEN